MNVLCFQFSLNGSRESSLSGEGGVGYKRCGSHSVRIRRRLESERFRTHRGEGLCVTWTGVRTRAVVLLIPYLSGNPNVVEQSVGTKRDPFYRCPFIKVKVPVRCFIGFLSRKGFLPSIAHEATRPRRCLSLGTNIWRIPPQNTGVRGLPSTPRRQCLGLRSKFRNRTQKVQERERWWEGLFRL